MDSLSVIIAFMIHVNNSLCVIIMEWDGMVFEGSFHDLISTELEWKSKGI